MKLLQLSSLVAFMASGALAHSWLECVDTWFKDVNQNMPENYEQSEKNREYFKSNVGDMADKREYCKGFPRNISPYPRMSGPDFTEGTPVMPANWVDESTNYMYDFRDIDSNGKAFACRDCQRTRTDGALPMPTVRPGQDITLRWWGNGHSTKNPLYANPRNRDPGVVRIYWSGEAGKELTYAEELNEENWIPGSQQGFAADNIVDFSNTPVPGRPDQNIMKEWGNYMKFTIPKDIKNGIHTMYWVWAWNLSNSCPASGPRPVDANTYSNDFKNSYSTCFDIKVVDSTETGSGVSDSHSKWKEEAAKEPSAQAEGCHTPCFVGGSSQICDPSTGASCPPCRIRVASKEHPDCYDTCNQWLKGDMCPTGGSKLKRHQHRRHRRSMM